MQVRRSVGVLAATVAVVVSMVGCSKSASGSGDAVTFTDNVCGSFIPFLEAASKPPNVSTSDPVKASAGVSQYLGNAVTAVEKAITGLDHAGKSPVAGGDEVVAKTKAALAQIKTAFSNAKATLDSAPNTPTAKAAALNKAASTMSSLSNLPDPTADLKANAELNAAAEKAPNCQKMKTIK
ncbi:MAG: hypothetical protein QOF63_3912 [Thermoanaerobaculia bacterium]|jgi:hypothetical protein|nr:hypothetical protein [Thermoanaerobaculia bacterium]